MNELILYDAACRALAQARSTDEAKEFLDKAIALRAYAKQAKNKQLEIDAAEIRFRAERRIGELMEAQREAGLMATGGDAMKARVGIKPEATTLAEAGIDKNLAHRARSYAAIPEKEFDGILSKWRDRVEDENERVSSDLLRASRQHTHVSLNSGENEWYTPPHIIESAKQVLGKIDLDPASSEKANSIVGAASFFTLEQNGLSREWPIGTIWMNPPYAQPLITHFCSRFTAEMQRGSTGIALVNNATETEWFQSLASCCQAICLLKGRVKFLDPYGNPGAPLQGQAALYSGKFPGLFSGEFRNFGLVVRTGNET